MVLTPDSLLSFQSLSSLKDSTKCVQYNVINVQCTFHYSLTSLNINIHYINVCKCLLARVQVVILAWSP